MENEGNISDISDTNLNKKLELNDKKIFPYDYKNQKIDNNINYLEWKDSIIKEYSNDAKIFKCKRCKILFYSKKEDMIKKPYYSMPCPICNNSICYFCSCDYNCFDRIYCCRRRILNICLCISGPYYADDEIFAYPEIFFF